MFHWVQGGVARDGRRASDSSPENLRARLAVT